MVRERVIDAHTLRVRDTELVRVPLAQRVLVTVVEPLLEGLREMVQHTKEIHSGSKFHMSKRLLLVEPILALLLGLQRELSN